ncbi:hypothetical protein PMAYCL1PPCAC_00164, partial [Pristionchus mayeri]
SSIGRTSPIGTTALLWPSALVWSGSPWARDGPTTSTRAQADASSQSPATSPWPRLCSSCPLPSLLPSLLPSGSLSSPSTLHHALLPSPVPALRLSLLLSLSSPCPPLSPLHPLRFSPTSPLHSFLSLPSPLRNRCVTYRTTRAYRNLGFYRFLPDPRIDRVTSCPH